MYKRLLLIILGLLILLFLQSAVNAETLFLPDAVERIEDEAFCGDSSLDKVVIPEGCVEIGSRAFADSGIISIEMPGSVARIAADAFEHVENLSVSAQPGTMAYSWALQQGWIPFEAPSDSTVYEFCGHYYQVFYDKLSWEEAAQKCNEMGGYLATVTSYRERQLIESMTYRKGRKITKTLYWLGGKQQPDGEWAWITGENWSFERWLNEEKPTEPPTGDHPKAYLQYCTPYIFFFTCAENNPAEDQAVGYICEWGEGEPIYSDSVWRQCSLGQLRMNLKYALRGTAYRAVFTIKCQGAPGWIPLQLGDNRNGHLGIMLDNGMNGDETAGDGIYTFTYEPLLFTHQGPVLFSVSLGDLNAVHSNTVELPLVDSVQEAEPYIVEGQLDDLGSLIYDTASPFMDSEGYVSGADASTALAQVYAALEQEKNKGNLRECVLDETSVYVKTASGIGLIYAPSIEGTNAGDGEAELTVIPIHPHEDVADRSHADDILSTVKAVVAAMDNFAYSSSQDYHPGSVTINTVKTVFGKNRVVIWNGHGTFHKKLGPMLMTNEAFNKEKWKNNTNNYKTDVDNDAIVFKSDGLVKYAYITPKFFDSYCKDLSNSLILFGACHSAQTVALGKALINNHASAVLGFTNEVESAYAGRTLYTILACMATVNPETNQFYTLNEACEYAKILWGANDYIFWSRKGQPEKKNSNKIAAPEIITGSNPDYRFKEAVNLKFNVQNRLGDMVEGALVTVTNGIKPYSFGMSSTNLQSRMDEIRNEIGIPYLIMQNAIQIPKNELGSYNVIIQAEHYSNVLDSITVSEGGELNYTLRLNGKFDGKVVDAETGKPLKDADVFIQRKKLNGETESVQEITKTNTEGQYSLSNLDIGTYDTTFSLEGYKDAAMTFTLDGEYNWELNQNIRLEPKKYEYHGVVLDMSDGEPLPGALVTCRYVSDTTTQFNRSQHTDEAGKFDDRELPAGRYELTFSREGYKQHMVSIVLEAEQPSVELTVYLEPESIWKQEYLRILKLHRIGIQAYEQAMDEEAKWGAVYPLIVGLQDITGDGQPELLFIRINQNCLNEGYYEQGDLYIYTMSGQSAVNILYAKNVYCYGGNGPNYEIFQPVGSTDLYVQGGGNGGENARYVLTNGKYKLAKKIIFVFTGDEEDSEYYIDGASVSRAAYLKALKEFNIQKKDVLASLYSPTKYTFYRYNEAVAELSKK